MSRRTVPRPTHPSTHPLDSPLDSPESENRPSTQTRLRLNTLEELVEFVNEDIEDEDTPFIDMPDTPIHKHLTDMETWAIIRSQTGVTNPTAFQQLDRTIQNNTFVILKQEGASIKQIQRLTGIGRNIIQRA